ncbi:MAG: glycoside hydrolase family 13 protein [Ferruginibacter sp.]|nr:glycoside hydrolase family 13 protein [Ferruginibacter sp.]
MRKIIVVFYIVLSCTTLKSFAQQTQLYPTNWWIGMKWKKVQILVYNNEKNIKNSAVKINYPGVLLTKINKLENESYLALDVTVSATAKPGIVKIILSGDNKTETIEWPLEMKKNGNGKKYAQGVRSEDFVYLLMPDRFSNGDSTNDKVAGLKDQSVNRDSMFHRHGGDLQGVINHLDYLKELGVTTVWMTPVLLNDMNNRTEHGYAITNHYQVDPRLGGNALYKKLSDAIHAKGMKLIQDAVYNHVGARHFTVLDKPMKNWLHEWPNFTQTTYRDQVLFDPYAAPSQTKKMSHGWFVKNMPDLNQQNPFVVNYLIQNALWSVEEFGVDGWRIDTYIYNDLPFMNKCNKALTDEYPAITMFGETWVHGVVNQSYFCENNLQTTFKSNLPNTTDFQMLLYGIQPALNEKFGWTDGLMKLYNTAAQDILYKNPMGEVIFLDNHDLSRFYSVVNEDIAKYKMALGWLLTYRGIPQLYYGDEILMKGFSNPDGLVRSDFLGGWVNDAVTKFTKEGRTKQENDVFDFIKTLANFRKQSSALKTGKMMQYLPENEVYTYFRYDDKETIICIMNMGDQPKEINLKEKYPDIVTPFKNLFNVITNDSHSLAIIIPPKTLIVGKLF